MFNLSGKKALVTGATGGIGEAIAASLKAAGATVTVSGTNPDKLSALAANYKTIACNLSDSASVQELPKKAEEVMGGLDILINNAGITRDNIFMRMKDEEWEDVIKVNLLEQQRSGLHYRPNTSHQRRYADGVISKKNASDKCYFSIACFFCLPHQSWLVDCPRF